jgi:hypothetical protein
MTVFTTIVVLVILAICVLSQRRWPRWVGATTLLILSLFFLDSSASLARRLVSARRSQGRLTEDYRDGVEDMWQRSSKTRDRRLLILIGGLVALSLMPQRPVNRPKSIEAPEAGPRIR